MIARESTGNSQLISISRLLRKDNRRVNFVQPGSPQNKQNAPYFAQQNIAQIIKKE